MLLIEGRKKKQPHLKQLICLKQTMQQ